MNKSTNIGKLCGVLSVQLSHITQERKLIHTKRVRVLYILAVSACVQIEEGEGT